MAYDYSFNMFNKFCGDGVCQSIKEYNLLNKKPVFVCIGSDLVLGDSLGPLVGTFLKEKGCAAYVYGTLNMPITAKEIEYAEKYLKIMHPDSYIIAIDAAVGREDDVGLIRVLNKGLRPGQGVEKNLGEIGDASIIGIVSEKTEKNYKLFNLTRLNLVYKMAEKISEGIIKYLININNDIKKQIEKPFGA